MANPWNEKCFECINFYHFHYFAQENILRIIIVHLSSTCVDDFKILEKMLHNEDYRVNVRARKIS